MSPEEQAKQLNERVVVRIGCSKIHGVGVIAVKDIPKGTKLYLDNVPEVYSLPYDKFDLLDKEVRELLVGRWPQIVNGSKFIYPDVRYQAYCNHSETPNYDIKTDTTLKKIKKGEEITEDYREIEGFDKVYKWIKK
jgi:SET domain-containing protein